MYNKFIENFDQAVNKISKDIEQQHTIHGMYYAFNDSSQTILITNDCELQIYFTGTLVNKVVKVYENTLRLTTEEIIEKSRGRRI